MTTKKGNMKNTRTPRKLGAINAPELTFSFRVLFVVLICFLAGTSPGFCFLLTLYSPDCLAVLIHINLCAPLNDVCSLCGTLLSLIEGFRLLGNNGHNLTVL